MSKKDVDESVHLSNDELKHVYHEPLIKVPSNARKNLEPIQKSSGMANASEPAVRIPSDEEFWLRVASSQGDRVNTSALIQRRYEWRGYLEKQTDQPNAAASLRQNEHEQLYDKLRVPSKMVLAAYNKDQNVVGTITAKVDIDVLNAEGTFPDTLAKYRQQNIRMGEFSGLAIEPGMDRAILGALFHAAYLFLARVHNSQMVVIEVNPRHVRYYEQVYGFKPLTEPRTCERVNAPAVLMGADCTYIDREVFRIGGTYNPQNRATRSIYPYFFDVKEELGVAKRLFSDIVPVHQHDIFVKKQQGEV